MQIAFSFEEMSQIILAHVRTRMNVVANTIDIPSTYNKRREDFCVVTNVPEAPRVQLVAHHEQDQTPDFP